MPKPTVLPERLGKGGRRVFDFAGLMSEREIASLEEIIANMRKQWNMDIIVLTSFDAKTDKSQDFADNFYDTNGFGEDSDFRGFVFFIDMHNRVGTVSTTGLMIRYVTDSRLDLFFDIVYPYLASGEYGQAAYMALDQISSYLSAGIPDGQYNQDEHGNKDFFETPTPYYPSAD